MNTNTPAKAGTKRILVIDDQASNTRLLKLYLEGTAEYVVKEENNPSAAVQTAEEFEPDLILLDVMMPKVDGGELAARFRAAPKLKAVPIVFVTAAVTKNELAGTNGQIGGFPFIAKPIVLTDVIACLKAQLGG